MDENFDDFNESEINDLVDKFEEKIKNRQSFFFDVEEYEILIDYYIENDNVEKADILLKNAVAQHPDSVTLLLKKAQVYVYSDKPDLALDLLNKLEKMEPENSDVFFAKGAIYSQLQRSEKAIEEYQKAISKSEALDEVYMNIAFEYEHLNNYIKSIEYFRKAIEINSENDMVLYELSFCYEQAALLNDGISFFIEFLDNNPYNRTAWSVLGSTYNADKQVEKAIECFDYAIAIDDKDSAAYYQKATVYYSNQQYTKAIEIYQEILDLKLEYFMATPYFFMGECYEKMEEYETALGYYTESIKIDDNNPDAWVGRGICHFELKMINEALLDVKKGISLSDPDSVSDYKLIMAEMLYKENLEGDLELYKEIVEEHPDNSDAWLDYSDALRDRDCLSEAIGILVVAAKTYPDKVEFYYRLAALLLLNGETNNAFQVLTTAISKDELKKNMQEFYGYINELELDERFLDIIEQFKRDIDNQKSE